MAEGVDDSAARLRQIPPVAQFANLRAIIEGQTAEAAREGEQVQGHLRNFRFIADQPQVFVHLRQVVPKFIIVVIVVSFSRASLYLTSLAPLLTRHLLNTWSRRSGWRARRVSVCPDAPSKPQV